MTTATHKESIRAKAKRAALNRWKLETLTGILGLESLEKQNAMSQANQEAENRYVRKNVWGQTDEQLDQPAGQQSEDMTRGHILGDVTYPTPIVVNNPPPQQPPKSQLLPTLALAAATMIPTTGAAAGIIGYLLAQPKPPAQVQPVQPQQYEEFNLGLGRLEDYQQ